MSATQNRATRRASAKSNGHRKTLSLSDWAHPAVISVPFAGYPAPVLYELPDLMYEVAAGVIPNEFLAAAERALGLDGNAGEPMPREERLDYIRMQLYVIASHLRGPRPFVDKEAQDKPAPDETDTDSAEDRARKRAIQWVLKKMPIPHRNHLWNLSVSHQIDSESAAATFRLGVPSETPGDDGGEAEAEAE